MEFDRIIVDGNYIARTMFEVHKRLTAKVDGEVFPTGMTHGFLTKLINLQRDYEGQLWVVWDAGISRRRKIDWNYKRNRRDKDKDWEDKELYLDSRKVLKWFLKLTGIRQVWKPGDEGDDIMFTLSQRFDENSLLVTNDHDLHQAIRPNVSQLIVKRDRVTVMSERRLEQTKGVTPEQFTWVMSLAGCSGDGVAGIPGVGMKTALKYVIDWPTFVPTLLGFNHAEEIVEWYPITDEKNIVTKGTKYFPEGSKGPPKKLRDCIENPDVVVLTHKLIQLYDVWPVSIRWGQPDIEALEVALDRFKLHELSGRLSALGDLWE